MPFLHFFYKVLISTVITVIASLAKRRVLTHIGVR